MDKKGITYLFYQVHEQSMNEYESKSELNKHIYIVNSKILNDHHFKHDLILKKKKKFYFFAIKIGLERIGIKENNFHTNKLIIKE